MQRRFTLKALSAAAALASLAVFPAHAADTVAAKKAIPIVHARIVMRSERNDGAHVCLGRIRLWTAARNSASF